MLENARSKRELDLRGRTGLTTYLRASASFGSRRHSRAPSRPQAPQAARDGGWLEPAERASLWRSALSEPYRRNQHLNNSLQTRFQPRHPRGAAVRARRHPASIAISVPLRSGQRVTRRPSSDQVLVSPQANETVRTRDASAGVSARMVATRMQSALREELRLPVHTRGSCRLPAAAHLPWVVELSAHLHVELSRQACAHTVPTSVTVQRRERECGNFAGSRHIRHPESASSPCT